ncbi:MAG: T9SS type A sorting domain-containing protein [Bacteroidales bacterium]|nr:T9SS type A sorting domain-containing protein [Bacteroidales bacterium]
MKKIAVIIFIINSSISLAQVYCGYIAIPQYMYFDNNDENWEYFLEVDTINYPNNIWQIGRPLKTIIDSAYSSPNAIITDTNNTYPTNNTSVFIIKHVDQGGYSSPHSAEFAGYYKVNSDSLNDYGLIEFSHDNGTTWINIISDTIYDQYIYWHTPKPNLTGNSNGWKNFFVDLAMLGLAFEIDFNDTILLKFSFISDAVHDSLDGLVFDNFEFCDGTEGIDELGYKNFSSTVFPNPSNGQVTIEFENPTLSVFNLEIFDGYGRLVKSINHLNKDYIKIDLIELQAGIYYYSIVNREDKLRSNNTFIIEK